MKRQEHREPRERASKPGERVSLDFHDYPEGINDYTSCGILTDRESGLCWDYYFVNRQEESLLAMLKHFTQMLDTMYDIKLRVIETDNELQKANSIRGWLTEKGIRVDESAPRTQQQNGSGERSGGFEAEFKQAQRDHLESHRQMSSWTEIARCDPRIRNSQILDCMWVFTYKFDKHGYLQKCKARLVVRGDQQQKSSAEDTYAATLAGKSFRTMLAIAARFDLELLQYDAVNAFVNAKLQSNVFMKLPPGFRGGHKEERVLLLHKALYGLRVAPLLWQTELGSTLRSSGCREVPDEPCCYQKDGVFIFFYVDDIVVAFKKGDRDTVS
ncbi:hypothetical protein NCS56_00381000 [Fusarium sp. Ph1]|nr:hypothetical protein NCS56_00381000 [Fusarium sp. Ph1]